MPLDQRVARRLKLRDLHILLEVVNAGSMGKAADRLHVSQPVISKAIASLERTLGARLLDRNMRGISLTDYGRAALKCGVAVFDDLKRGFEEIEFIADPAGGVVRVGCSDPEFASVVSAVINLLSTRYPRIVFELVRVDQAAPFRDLESRDVDFVVAEPVFKEDHMVAEILYADSAVVAVGLQSPWARRRRVDLMELVDEPWLLPAPGSFISSIVVDAFRARGLSAPQPVVVASSHAHCTPGEWPVRYRPRKRYVANRRATSISKSPPGNFARSVPECRHRDLEGSQSQSGGAAFHRKRARSRQATCARPETERRTSTRPVTYASIDIRHCGEKSEADDRRPLGLFLVFWLLPSASVLCAGFRTPASTMPTTRSGGRRPKSAKARNRGGGT
jgi:DNA-binding transcriptional LysR family regulator